MLCSLKQQNSSASLHCIAQAGAKMQNISLDRARPNWKFSFDLIYISRNMFPHGADVYFTVLIITMWLFILAYEHITQCCSCEKPKNS